MVPAGPPLSYEELAALVVAQAQWIVELEAEVAELRRHIAAGAGFGIGDDLINHLFN